MPSSVGRLLRWRPASLRTRTVILATAVVGVALIVAALALVALQRRTLRENVDDTIQLRVTDLTALAATGNLPAEIPVTDPEIALVQVVDASGNVVASTTNASGQPLLFDVQPSGSGDAWFETSDLPVDDEEFRVLARSVQSPDGPLTLYVAASLEPVSESVESLVSLLQFGIPVMLVAVAAGTWLVVGRSLQPIEGIRRRVEDISLSSLDQRVPVPGTRDEVARLAKTMNELLARLQAGHLRQEQFIADAAHELRSPLASLRTQLEVQAKADFKQGHPETVTLVEDVARLQSLADNLLLLASAGAATPTATVLVDLDDLVLEEARSCPVPPGKQLDTLGISAAAVRGEPEALRRLVRNLLDNALRHAASTVTLRLAEHDGRVRLTVTDDGPGIPIDDRDRVFERFVRLDAARVTGGTGLGLAICRAVAEAHGGAIVVEDRPSGGAVLAVDLPAAD